jgi:hypothetical protein
MDQAMGGSYLSQDARTVRNLFARSYIFLRNGTANYSGGVLSGAGATGTKNAWKDELVTSGNGVRFDLPIPGVGSLPMVHAQGATENLDKSGDWITGTTNDAVTNSASGEFRRLTPTVASAQHETYSATLTLLALTTYSVRSIIDASGLSPGDYAQFNLGNGIGRICVTIDGNGSTVAGAIGTGVVLQSYSVQNIGGSRRLITLTGTLNAGVNGLSIIFTRSATPVVARPTIAFDGVSSVLVYNGQVEQSPIPTLYLPTAGAAVSRTTDRWVWAPPVPLPATAGTLIRPFAPYLWTDVVSKGRQVSLGRKAVGTSWLSESNGVLNHFLSYSESSSVTDLNLGNVGSSGKIRVHSQTFDGSALSTRVDGVVSAGPVGATMASTTEIEIGSEALSGNGNRELFGLEGALYVPGGATLSEELALWRLLNRTLVPVA